MLLYEKYSSFIFSSYFTPHYPFQWVKYSSNQKIIWISKNTEKYLGAGHLFPIDLTSIKPSKYILIRVT